MYQDTHQPDNIVCIIDMRHDHVYTQLYLRLVVVELSLSFTEGVVELSLSFTEGVLSSLLIDDESTSSLTKLNSMPPPPSPVTTRNNITNHKLK